jgi:hypothetical protein
LPSGKYKKLKLLFLTPNCFLEKMANAIGFSIVESIKWSREIKIGAGLAEIWA